MQLESNSFVLKEVCQLLCRRCHKELAVGNHEIMGFRTSKANKDAILQFLQDKNKLGLLEIYDRIVIAEKTIDDNREADSIPEKGTLCRKHGGEWYAELYLDESFPVYYRFIKLVSKPGDDVAFTTTWIEGELPEKLKRQMIYSH